MNKHLVLVTLLWANNSRLWQIAEVVLLGDLPCTVYRLDSKTWEEIEFKEHVALPKQPINQFKPA